MVDAVLSGSGYSYLNQLLGGSNAATAAPQSIESLLKPANSTVADARIIPSTSATPPKDLASLAKSVGLSSDVVSLLQDFDSSEIGSSIANLLNQKSSTSGLGGVYEKLLNQGATEAIYKAAQDKATSTVSADPMQALLGQYRTAMNAYNQASQPSTTTTKNSGSGASLVA